MLLTSITNLPLTPIPGRTSQGRQRGHRRPPPAKDTQPQRRHLHLLPPGRGLWRQARQRPPHPRRPRCPQPRDRGHPGPDRRRLAHHPVRRAPGPQELHHPEIRRQHPRRREGDPHLLIRDRDAPPGPAPEPRRRAPERRRSDLHPPDLQRDRQHCRGSH
jgi:hypothetical protein